MGVTCLLRPSDACAFDKESTLCMQVVALTLAARQPLCWHCEALAARWYVPFPFPPSFLMLANARL